MLHRKGLVRLLQIECVLGLMFSAACGAQAIGSYGQGTSFGQIHPDAHNGYDGFVDSGSADQEKRLRALNADRQKGMISDADKLLKLARQLDTEIAGNKTEGLTADELRKFATIEKLARSVKQKMILSWGSEPEFHQPSFPQGAMQQVRVGPG
jgi:hypothetical protein